MNEPNAAEADHCQINRWSLICSHTYIFHSVITEDVKGLLRWNNMTLCLFVIHSWEIETKNWFRNGMSEEWTPANALFMCVPMTVSMSMINRSSP